MKKYILSVAVIFGLGFTQANAQNVSVGIKADANMSNFILTDLDNTDSNPKAGASLGGFVKVDFCDHFALQPELMFHYKSSELKQLGVENNYEFWGVEIPVYAMGQWKLKDESRIYVGVGPYVGLGLSAKNTDNDFDLYEKNSNDEASMQRWDFGVGATLGYEFSCGLQVNAGYKVGLIDALDAGHDNATMLPNTLSLGLGYRF